MKSLWIRRFFSYLIDWYVITLLIDVVIKVYTYIIYGQSIIITLDNFDLYVAFGLLVTMFIINCLYFIIIPYLLDGVTLGKKIFKLKTINKNGDRASIINLFCKEVIGNVIIEGSFYPFSNYVFNLLLIISGESIIKIIAYIHTFIGIISIMILFTKRARMIHDYIGNTMTICTK